jgi:hypothetical protein
VTPERADADREQDKNDHNEREKLFHRNGSNGGWRWRQVVRQGERNKGRKPAALWLIGPLRERVTQLIDGDLEPAPNRPVGNPEASRDFRAAVAVDKMQEHRRSIRLGKRQHLVGDRALQLYAFDELGRRADRPSILEASLSFLTSGVAAAAGMGKVLDDAREPRPKWLVGVRLTPRGDEPGLLRHVVCEHRVLDERAREFPDPSHLREQLLAWWNPGVVHLQPLSAAKATIVRENRSGVPRLALIGGRISLFPPTGDYRQHTSVIELHGSHPFDP